MSGNEGQPWVNDDRCIVHAVFDGKFVLFCFAICLHLVNAQLVYISKHEIELSKLTVSTFNPT